MTPMPKKLGRKGDESRFANRLSSPSLSASEKSSSLHEDLPPPGSLLLEDMGYFDLARKAQLTREGVFWISGCQPQTAFFNRQDQRLDLLKLVRAAGDEPGGCGREDWGSAASGVSPGGLAQFSGEGGSSSSGAAQGRPTARPHAQRRGFGVV